MELRYIAKDEGNQKIVRVRNVNIGDGDFVIIAGPCAVENRVMLMETAGWIRNNGALS